MRLYIETMDAVLVEFQPDGRIRLEREEWTKPTVQETRAILYAARTEIDNLSELIATLESAGRSS
jgi:hypothetical protein